MNHQIPLINEYIPMEYEYLPARPEIPQVDEALFLADKEYAVKCIVKAIKEIFKWK